MYIHINEKSRPINPWIIGVTVTLATFMELLDTAIANVSLPHIAGGLATSYDESTWVLTSYLVANAVVLPLSAWLSRMLGRKRYYMICVALFTGASLLCGLAPSLGWLIFFRVLQGVAGGGLAPVEQAILVDTFPVSQRAAAFALYSMAIVTAPVVGPPLGGWITDNWSWRWIFFINIPIGALSLFLTSRVVRDPPEFLKESEAARARGWGGVDYAGIGLVAVGFASLEVVLDRGQRLDWFESPFVVAFLTVALIALAAAVWWERRHPDPVVEIRLLEDRNFALAAVFYTLFGFVLFGSTVLIPQMLQSLYGYTATDAGLVLGPGALVIVVLAPVVVRVLPMLGARTMVLAGFSILAAAMWRFASFNPATDYAHFALTRALQGLGIAAIFVPISQLAYSYIPQEKNNKASSLTNLFRNQGGSFGIAFVTTMLERRASYHQHVLAGAADAFTGRVSALVAQISSRLVLKGVAPADAAGPATAAAYRLLQQQAALLGSMDCFHVLGWVALLALPAAMMIRRFQLGGGPAGGH